VLWESAVALGSDGWEMSGLTDNYLRVHTKAQTGLWNQLTSVELITKGESFLEGRFENNEIE
jgi:hypothetical protein